MWIRKGFLLDFTRTKKRVCILKSLKRKQNYRRSQGWKNSEVINVNSIYLLNGAAFTTH